MATINLFPDATTGTDQKRFKWDHLPLTIQLLYNRILSKVMEHDAVFLTKDPSLPNPEAPNYYNINYCLALTAECKRNPALPDIDANTSDADVCLIDSDIDAFDYMNRPTFHYVRSFNPQNNVPVAGGDLLNLSIDIKSLTGGTLIWLYFYERMGIFKIAGALMDDYNYKGKYPISSRIGTDGKFANDYSELMEEISLLYRIGMSSNLRDRICAYQRVFGVTVENNLNADSEKNEGFMKTFNKLIEYMLEFYKAKQLAQAIQSGGGNGRSSVATQTSIRDTIIVLKQHFETMEYGRNLINTYIGIATVYATICLIRLVKDEIGIPRQYDAPEEFIPAAYDILVLKRPVTPSAVNRFSIYDNCASYGYRLLTDIQLADISQFRASSLNSPLDAWLNDVEGIVEGYNNAYKGIEEPAGAIV